MSEACHMALVPAGALWFDPSNITSLIPLWLVVLIADGLDSSTTFSVLKDIWFSNPVNQSKLSSKGWLADMSVREEGNEEVSSAMEGGESL